MFISRSRSDPFSHLSTESARQKSSKFSRESSFSFSREEFFLLNTDPCRLIQQYHHVDHSRWWCTVDTDDKTKLVALLRLDRRTSSAVPRISAKHNDDCPMVKLQETWRRRFPEWISSPITFSYVFWYKRLRWKPRVSNRASHPMFYCRYASEVSLLEIHQFQRSKCLLSLRINR